MKIPRTLLKSGGDKKKDKSAGKMNKSMFKRYNAEEKSEGE